MPSPVHAPRVNNNDDFVKLIQVNAETGASVKRGDVLLSVETDKAVVDVEAETDGYVLSLPFAIDETVAVGAVIMWIGDTPDETVPDLQSVKPGNDSLVLSSARPTAKARTLLKKHGLDAGQIPHQGARLTAEDVESFLAGTPAVETGPRPVSAQLEERKPAAQGSSEPMGPVEHGMYNTVLWHRDSAVPTYLEVEYDATPWREYAAAYASEHKLLMDPLLPLMGYRLVRLAHASKKLNTTIYKDTRFQYSQVNLGVTIQVADALYLTVLRNAEAMQASEFIAALGDLQRKAIGHKLGPDELQGATVGFTSMARWRVTRHVPVLPTHTSLMVAHVAPLAGGDVAVLGATYDHRVLSGYDVVTALQGLGDPNRPIPEPTD